MACLADKLLTRRRATFSSRLNSAMVSSLNEVNALQQTSKTAQEAFQMGGDIPLTEVVMNMQKASLGFRGDSAGS